MRLLNGYFSWRTRMQEWDVRSSLRHWPSRSACIACDMACRNRRLRAPSNFLEPLTNQVKSFIVPNSKIVFGRTILCSSNLLFSNITNEFAVATSSDEPTLRCSPPWTYSRMATRGILARRKSVFGVQVRIAGSGATCSHCLHHFAEDRSPRPEDSATGSHEEHDSDSCSTCQSVFHPVGINWALEVPLDKEALFQAKPVWVEKIALNLKLFRLLSRAGRPH